MAKDTPQMNDNALFTMRAKTGMCEPDNNTGSDKRYDEAIAVDPFIPVGPSIKNGSSPAPSE